MIQNIDSLQALFDGWQGYNQSLIHAIQPLTPQQLAWRPAEKMNSVGELARHISLGRVTWFARMSAPGSQALVDQIAVWETDEDGNRDIVESEIHITDQPAELVRWLEMSWGMIAETLITWTITDLDQSYSHVWNGSTYAPTRQWTIWRIMNHDLHHGGELSLMLGMQGIETFELGALFGHIVDPPLAG